MAQKKIIKNIYFFIMLTIFFTPQISKASVGTGFNVGRVSISADLLGPLFGQIALGVGVDVFPQLVLGVSGAYYYHSSFSTTQVEGGKGQFDATFYVFPEGHTPFLGASVGYENVDVKKDSTSETIHHSGLIWSVRPGYSWLINPFTRISAGAEGGFGLGEYYVVPFVGASILL